MKFSPIFSFFLWHFKDFYDLLLVCYSAIFALMNSDQGTQIQLESYKEACLSISSDFYHRFSHRYSQI